MQSFSYVIGFTAVDKTLLNLRLRP